MCWNLTRNSVPLDVPISASKRDFRTAEFAITAAGSYDIELVLDHGSEDGWCALSIGECGGKPAVAIPDWFLLRKENVIAHGLGITDGAWGGNRPGCYLGTFQSSNGRYILELRFPEGATRLNSYEPRLIVRESWFEREQAMQTGWYAFLIAFLTLPMGVVLLMRAMIAHRVENADEFARTWSFTDRGRLRAL